MKQQVILVNQRNHQIGVEEKIKAHQEGKLHRAFSILIFNDQGEILICQRAKNKYHSGGLWSNAVCSHPKPEEKTVEAIHRRLKEEMGFDCPLKKLFSFHYRTKFENGLIENEIDTVYSGIYNDEIKLDGNEAMGYKWISIPNLKKNIAVNPDKYTSWFKKIIQENKIL
jgi:isopentenyl-diphosphate delta-isomerase